MRRKKVAFCFAVVGLMILAIGATLTGCGKSSTVETVNATFEGFYNSNGQEVTDKAEVFAPDSQVYKFKVENGDSKLFKIYNQADQVFKNPVSVAAEDGAYVLQNRLKVGQTYRITIKNDTITEVQPTQQTQSVQNGVVNYTPGQRTLKNFLKTAIAPMGTLMVIGGGWDLQDVGAGNEARTIGVDSVWKDEYNSQTVYYNWMETYPHNGWNKDHFRGFDASGYLGWVLYNAMYDNSLTYPGLVFAPNVLTEVLTQEYNFGEYITQDELESMSADQIAQSFQPGDIVALEQHLYIVLGTCSDDSIVTVQCATIMSKSGVYGGGVQLAVLNPRDDLNEDCEAFRLVEQYTKKVCPQWSERYNVAVKMTEYYLAATSIARMDVAGGMFMDPDGYASMGAAEILADIFG